MSDLILQAEALWRALVEALDEGLMVLDADGVVYANDSAATLLKQDKLDLIGLDEDDVLALCQPDRLDIERLTTVLTQDLLGPRPVESYRVMAGQRRLLVAPFALDAEGGRLRCLLLQGDEHWRDAQIAERLVRDMRSPLNFLVNYSGALLKRLQASEYSKDELLQLTKVVRGGAKKAMEQFESLVALHNTGLDGFRDGAGDSKVELLDVLKVAVGDVWEANSRDAPSVKASMSPLLPRIRMKTRYLYTILVGLLQEATSRMNREATLMIRVTQHNESTIQVDLEAQDGKANVPIRTSVFDGLPLATVEQLIVLHGGRLWLTNEPKQQTKISFTLPV